MLFIQTMYGQRSSEVTKEDNLESNLDPSDWRIQELRKELDFRANFDRFKYWESGDI